MPRREVKREKALSGKVKTTVWTKEREENYHAGNE